MDTDVRGLFSAYESLFNRALAGGEVDMDAIAALYAEEVIGAAPAGVRTGRNDAEFVRVLAEGYAHYRAIGTREMRITGLRITPIDALHCIAHVDWRARYARKGHEDVTIDFPVHYLVQTRDGTPRVFGWVTGDEQAALREHGIL